MVDPKIDGVIEAVHYGSNRQISQVRLYERHGAVWSDRILLGRNEMIELLTKGKHFVIGQRRIMMGGKFDTGKSILYGSSGKRNFTFEDQPDDSDLLPGVPLY